MSRDDDLPTKGHIITNSPLYLIHPGVAICIINVTGNMYITNIISIKYDDNPMITNAPTP